MDHREDSTEDMPANLETAPKRSSGIAGENLPPERVEEMSDSSTASTETPVKTDVGELSDPLRDSTSENDEMASLAEETGTQELCEQISQITVSADKTPDSSQEIHSEGLCEQLPRQGKTTASTEKTQAEGGEVPPQQEEMPSSSQKPHSGTFCKELSQGENCSSWKRTYLTKYSKKPLQDKSPSSSKKAHSEGLREPLPEQDEMITSSKKLHSVRFCEQPPQKEMPSSSEKASSGGCCEQPRQDEKPCTSKKTLSAGLCEQPSQQDEIPASLGETSENTASGGAESQLPVLSFYSESEILAIMKVSTVYEQLSMLQAAIRLVDDEVTGHVRSVNMTRVQPLEMPYPCALQAITAARAQNAAAAVPMYDPLPPMPIYPPPSTPGDNFYPETILALNQKLDTMLLEIWKQNQNVLTLTRAVWTRDCGCVVPQIRKLVGMDDPSPAPISGYTRFPTLAIVLKKKTAVNQAVQDLIKNLDNLELILKNREILPVHKYTGEKR